MSVKLRDTDMGLRKLVRTMARAAKGRSVAVGVFPGTHYKTGVPVVDVATVHEFGTARVPRRSFIRGTIDSSRDKIDGAAKVSAKHILDGAPIDLQMSRYGEFVVGLIQQRIADGIPPALAESTIARKGSSKPLIDTGLLRQSITYEVRK